MTFDRIIQGVVFEWIFLTSASLVIYLNSTNDGVLEANTPANITCKMQTYTSTYTQIWTVNSGYIAGCIISDCTENMSNPKRYFFKSDITNGIFNFDIYPVLHFDDKNVIGCSDGMNTVTLMLNVTDQTERVKNCSCKCNIGRSLGFLVFTVTGLYGVLYYKKGRIAWTQQTHECITTHVFCCIVCCVLLLIAGVGLTLACIGFACKVKAVCITGIVICGFDVIVLISCVILVCKKSSGEDRETGSASTNHGGLFLSSECSGCSAHALSFVADGLLLIIAVVGLVLAFKNNETDEKDFCIVEVTICAFDTIFCCLPFISDILFRNKALIEPPQNLRCEKESLTHASVTIIWEKGYSAYPYESYRLLYKDDTAMYWKTVVLNDDDKMSVKTVRYTFYLLEPDSRYQVKVKAENKDEESDFTEVLHFSTKVGQQTSSRQGVEEDAIQHHLSQEMETAVL